MLILFTIYNTNSQKQEAKRTQKGQQEYENNGKNMIWKWTQKNYVNVALKLFCLGHGMITDVNIPEDRNSHLLLSYQVMLSPSGCMIYADKQPQSIPMSQILHLP